MGGTNEATFQVVLADGATHHCTVNGATLARFERSTRKNFFGQFDVESIEDLAHFLAATLDGEQPRDAGQAGLGDLLDGLRAGARVERARQLVPLEHKGRARLQFAILLALAEVTGKPLSEETLAEIRREIGDDLPGDGAGVSAGSSADSSLRSE